MSIAGGPHTAFARGEKSGCTAIQIFTKNQNRWAAKSLDDAEIAKFDTERERTGIFCFAHAAYLPNLASPDKALWRKSIEAMKVEMERCDALGLPYLIFHPGSHISDTRKNGVERVARSLRELYDSGNFSVALTLEITAGQGTNLGNSFEELAEIIRLSGVGGLLKTCYDTCHAFAAGYDIREKGDYENTWREFDEILGIDKLAVIHLNDSKHDLGSRKDRHEHIGKGYIGLDGFRNIMNDDRLSNIPMVLETPKGLNTRDGSDIDMDKVNLKTLRELVND
ncbi:deoxyribonuclease IV [bacterium]|nr:MAG: deoxyribonuclease IV [bacterium]